MNDVFLLDFKIIIHCFFCEFKLHITYEIFNNISCSNAIKLKLLLLLLLISKHRRSIIIFKRNSKYVFIIIDWNQLPNIFICKWKHWRISSHIINELNSMNTYSTENFRRKACHIGHVLLLHGQHVVIAKTPWAFPIQRQELDLQLLNRPLLQLLILYDLLDLLYPLLLFLLLYCSYWNDGVQLLDHNVLQDGRFSGS